MRYASGSDPAGERVVVGALALLGGWLLTRRLAVGRGRRARLPLAVPVLTAAAGFAMAAVSSSRARSSCAADLRSGDVVLVEGIARERRDPGSANRLTLSGVSIRDLAADRACGVDGLVVRVDGMPRLVEAGSRVTVRGEWLRMGRPSAWPRRPGRHGIVLGRVQPGDHAGPGRRDRPDRSVLASSRARASRRLASRLPPDVRPIARALVLAERDDLPGAVRSRFADAGLAHLLAISGLHVGLIGAAASSLLIPLLGPSRAAAAAALLVALYVSAIGAPPAALRAALLLAGWAAARTRGLPARSWDLLGAAALVTVITDPLRLVEPGFQLSFAGFAGLGSGVALGRLMLARVPTPGVFLRASARWPRGIGKRLRLVGLALAGGTGAFLATAPFAAAHFQHVAPVALVSHFVGTPLVGAAIGSLAMVLMLPAPLDSLGAASATASIRGLLAVAAALQDLPGAHSSVPAPSLRIWVAACLAAFGAWRFAKWGRLRPAAVPLAAAVSLLLAGPSIGRRLAPTGALLCTLDVGQGDAAVLRTSGGRWILFDAGPSFGDADAGRDVIVPFLRRHGARRIDLFVLSHPDQDHLGGFEAVHAAVPVFRIVDSGHAVPRESYGRFLARAEEEGIRWLPAAEADEFSLDGTQISVLGPAPGSRSGRVAGLGNESSLLLRASIDRTLVYLNTGDATIAEEGELLDRWTPEALRADVLKVGHHGSRTSTGEAFLRATRPSLAVVSAGRRNRYGHPHSEVLARLSADGGRRVWRTDRDGTLCVEVDRERGWRVAGEPDWIPARPVARVLTSQQGEK